MNQLQSQPEPPPAAQPLLTSPDHVNDQPNLTALSRFELFPIDLDGRSVREQQVVSDDEAFRSRVALSVLLAIGGPTRGVTTEDISEEGEDIRF